MLYTTKHSFKTVNFVYLSVYSHAFVFYPEEGIRWTLNIGYTCRLNIHYSIILLLN